MPCRIISFFSCFSGASGWPLPHMLFVVLLNALLFLSFWIHSADYRHRTLTSAAGPPDHVRCSTKAFATPWHSTPDVGRKRHCVRIDAESQRGGGGKVFHLSGSRERDFENVTTNDKKKRRTLSGTHDEPGCMLESATSSHLHRPSVTVVRVR